MTVRFKHESLSLTLLAVLAFAALPAHAATPASSTGTPASAVNVFIGTGGDGQHT